MRRYPSCSYVSLLTHLCIVTLLTDSYLVYFMRRSRKTSTIMAAKPADNESAYSFSTMPASTTYVSPTPVSLEYNPSLKQYDVK